jgi:adenylate cyclase
VIVKGKSEPVDVFTPCPDAMVNETSERAFAAFRARRWEEAEGLWGELLARNPGDRIASMHLERIRELRRSAPSPGWNGAIELEKL